MTRTQKQTKHNKLKNNEIIIYQENQVNIDNIINELKKEHKILEYAIEHNNF